MHTSAAPGLEDLVRFTLWPHTHTHARLCLCLWAAEAPHPQTQTCSEAPVLSMAGRGSPVLPASAQPRGPWAPVGVAVMEQRSRTLARRSAPSPNSSLTSLSNWF